MNCGYLQGTLLSRNSQAEDIQFAVAFVMFVFIVVTLYLLLLVFLGVRCCGMSVMEWCRFGKSLS